MENDQSAAPRRDLGVRELMAALPSLMDFQNSLPKDDPRPSGIGASSIGSECTAFLAYTLRGFPEDAIPSNVRRIFDVGHRLEDLVTDYIKDALPHGWRLLTIDPNTGEQFFQRAGHVRTYADGILVNVGSKEAGLIEVKTMNTSQFERFIELGVKRAKPGYYAQAQITMKLFDAPVCLFVVLNKNDQRIVTEVVEFDAIECSSLEANVELAMKNEARKKGEKESSYACKWCNKKGVCWSGDYDPAPSCQKCGHAEARADGGWRCSLHGVADPSPCPDFRLYQPLPKD